MSLIEVRNLTHFFNDKVILDDISFNLFKGEALGLLGQSGSGKSTIAKITMGLLKPKFGEIKFNNKIVKFKNLRQKRAFYKQAQIIFQDPLSAVNPRFSVKEIISEPLIYLSELDKKGINERVLKLIEVFKIEKKILDKPAHLISGGELGRVCLARAMAIKPKFLILDEALASFDITLQVEILKFLNTLKGEVSFLFISHDLRLVKAFCDRVIVLNNAKIVETSNAKDEFKSEIAKQFTSALLPAFIE